jgi:uncharacterized protein YegL
MQAPGLVSLVKVAQVSLQKANLMSHMARVALVLDVSGSMQNLYSSGKVQRLAEKALALATQFDDDGSIDIFTFGASARYLGGMDLGNFGTYIATNIRNLEGDTRYAAGMSVVRQHFMNTQDTGNRTPRSAATPVYVLYVTDGANSDKDQTIAQVVASSFEPIYWQFMAIGRSEDDFPFLQKLDDLKVSGSTGGGLLSNLFGRQEQAGRLVDNTGFFSVRDPESIADAELFDKMTSEYSKWVVSAPGLKLLTR